MKNTEPFIILRLNSVTMPMRDEEREILASLNARIIEIEGGSDDEISTVAGDADAIMVVSSYLRACVIRNLKKCRIISRMGTGYDKIDVEQATHQGIMVTNIPDFCTSEVADHTMALLLASVRRIKEYDLMMRKGKKPVDAEGIHRLSVQTVGLVGFGRIGQAVAMRCQAFGLRILVHDPQFSPCEAVKKDVRLVSLPHLLEESDYVCLLCPLLPSTREMIAMQQLKTMKSTAVIINTGRGELINEADLVLALKERIIRFAALDVFGGINVFAADGFSTDHAFFKLDNILITPHVSAVSEESLVECRHRSAQAVVDVLSGRWPLFLVNHDVSPLIPVLIQRTDEMI